MLTKAIMIYAVLTGGEVSVDYKGFESKDLISSAYNECLIEGEILRANGQILEFECDVIPVRKSL